MELQGKVGIVTGAGRGLGREIALELAREGMNVVVADINPDLLEDLTDEIKAMGRDALAVKADVTQSAETKKMAQETIDKFGCIDVLVNNAGVIIVEPFVDVKEENWDKVLGVNLKGTFLCCQAVAPHMIGQKSGKIVNISSVAGKKGNPMLAAYCSSKFGVIGLTMSLAQELGPHNIAVNAVCPGFIRTAMWVDHLNPAFSPVYELEPKEVFDAFIAANVPLQRPQTEADIAQCVAFLCKADNISGSTITVDGGHTMS